MIKAASAAAKLATWLYRLVCLLVSICRLEMNQHGNGACNTSELADPTKLQSYSISVLKPKRQVKDGEIPLSALVAKTPSSTSWYWRETAWTEAELHLTSATLCYKIKGTGVCELLLEDLIGIHVSETPSVIRPIACELSVHLFPFTSPNARKKVRGHCTITVQFDSNQEFVKNLQAAKECKNAILLQRERILQDTFGSVGETCDKESEGKAVLVPRNFLILINPMAGAQKGVCLFQKHVQPMLDAAEINYTVVHTERQNHAREMIKTYDLSNITGIVISSGDGLVYEVINGIMERQDWNTTIKIPIGNLPTGTGNALCASTLSESKEAYGLETAAFQIICGGVSPMDLATVQLPDGTSTYMAQMICWGLVADIDIESEKYRKIGKTRYILGALSCIWKKKIYRGKLSYLLSNKPTLEPNPQEPTSQGSSTGSEELSVCCDSPHDGGQPSQSIEHPSTDQVTLLSQRTPINLPATDLLAPLDEPVPESWVTKEDNFISLSTLMIPFVASDFYGDRNLPIGSGSFRLLWVDGNNISRKGLYDVMTGCENGSHTELESVHMVDVKAFRLEPLTDSGMITVDGEAVSYGNMQAQIHPGLCRVMSRKRRT